MVGFGLMGLGCMGFTVTWVRCVGAALLLVGGGCLYFFRDPSREVLQDLPVVLAPADGRVLAVEDEVSPISGVPGRVVRIFLSVFEPHIQRAPLAGTVLALQYQPGKFLDARHPEACRQNEQNRIVIMPQRAPERGEVVVTQIAGFIARRIVCWVEARQPVAMGQRLGLIQFGSQVDLWLPGHGPIQVKPGDHLKAGLSVVAPWP